MEYVAQAFQVLKTLVHAEANARAQKSGFFAAFLTLTRFLCVITNQFYACSDFCMCKDSVYKATVNTTVRTQSTNTLP